MGATYVYAIIPTEEEMVFDVAGVGREDNEVRSVSHGDLAAVVSPSPLFDYRGLKREDAIPHLVPHQRVVEAVMEHFPVLPVKFGTVLPDEARVRRLLEQGEALFRACLANFSGLMQMEVVVLWDLQAVFREISQEAPIARAKARAGDLPPEESIAERIEVGQMVQASLEGRRAALRDRLLPPLRELALDLVVNPHMSDAIVANLALLVDGQGRAALDGRLEELDQEFGGQLLFRCVGPLPPYSFATVEVQMPSFQAVDEARRRLGLGQAATAGEIKRAYYQLASLFHPDRNPADPEAETRMAELTRAYELLTTYAESLALATDNAGEIVCDFDREIVEGTLLITTRRQEALL